MRDKRIPQNKRVGEPLSVTYSIKITESQRIALMRLGPQWVRERIPQEVLDFFTTQYPYTKQAKIREALIEFVKKQKGKDR